MCGAGVDLRGKKEGPPSCRGRGPTGFTLDYLHSTAIRGFYNPECSDQYLLVETAPPNFEPGGKRRRVKPLRRDRKSGRLDQTVSRVAGPAMFCP
jgi:hypothetical protein